MATLPLLLAALFLAGGGPAAAECNGRRPPPPPVDPNPDTDADPIPPGGTPTPPSDGGGTPTPPPGGGGTPTPPPGGGGTPTPPSRGGRTAGGGNMSEWGLEHWEDWWHVHADRYLDLRRRVRESERAAATAAGEGTGRSDPGNPVSGPEAQARALLLETLRHREWEVRAAAALALGRSGSLEALPGFLRMIRSPARDVRGSAAVGAGLLEEAMAAEELGRIVLDPGEADHLRGVALIALGLLGGDAGGGVLLDFLSPAADRRRAGGIRRTQMLEETAVAALGLSRCSAAAPLLRRVLASGGPSDRTRAFAATSLARLGDRDALPLLAQALRADPEVLRQAAAVAAGVLCTAADTSFTAELARAAREDRDGTTRRFAALSLGRIGGPAAAATLVDLLAKGRSADRPFTALALGIGGVRAAGPALERLFRETGDPEVRGAYAISLGLLGWTGSAPDLLEVAASKGGHHLRGDCFVALGLMGCREAAVPARAVLSLDHPEQELLSEAAACLALLGDRRSLAALPAILAKGRDHAHGGAGYRVLGLLGDPGLLPGLGATVRDRGVDDATRCRTLEAMGAILDEHDIPVLSTVAMDAPFLLFQGPLRAVMGHR